MMKLNVKADNVRTLSEEELIGGQLPSAVECVLSADNTAPR
jgi:hypothetical protein